MRGSSCRTEQNTRAAEAANQRNQAVAAGRPLILVVAASLCSTPPGLSQTQPPWPEGTGKETVQKACVSCHALGTVNNARHNREEWTSVLHMMVTAGAPVPKDQIPVVTDYLGKEFPGKASAGSGGHSRKRRGFHQGMASANGSL
jgi:hypothetical protein